MQREPVVHAPVRRHARAAGALCLAAAGSAFAKDSWEREDGGLEQSGSKAPSNFEGDSRDEVRIYEGDFPEFDESATGGAAFLDTSGGDGPAIAQDLGFTVSWLYGGSCVADPSEGAGPFDWIFLIQILDGADPFADAEPDFYTCAPEGSQSNGLILPGAFGRAQFDRQPALATIRARPAHKLATGAGATVAVLDTGVDPLHPLLAGHVDMKDGWDFVDGDASAREAPDLGVDQNGKGFGHGTTVAGLVLAAAPDATILPVRVLDADSVGTTARLAAGIRWAVDRGADVVNMSLGGGPRTKSVVDAVAAGRARGVVFVAAAGRDRFQTDFPAREPGVLAVSGAGGAPGQVSGPATNVDGPYPGDRWYRGTGSSFSTALVSGGAALALERHPGIDGAGILAELTAGRRGRPRLDLVRLAR